MPCKKSWNPWDFKSPIQHPHGGLQLDQHHLALQIVGLRLVNAIHQLLTSGKQRLQGFLGGAHPTISHMKGWFTNKTLVQVLVRRLGDLERTHLSTVWHFFCVFLVGWWWKILDENGKNTLVRKNGNIEGMDYCLIIRMPTSPMIFFIKNYYHTPPNNKKIDVAVTTVTDHPCGPKKCFVSVDPIDPRRWDHRSDPHPLSQKGKWDPSRRSPVTSRSFGTPTRYVLFCWFPAGKGGRQPQKTGWGEFGHF